MDLGLAHTKRFLLFLLFLQEMQLSKSSDTATFRSRSTSHHINLAPSATPVRSNSKINTDVWHGGTISLLKTSDTEITKSSSHALLLQTPTTQNSSHDHPSKTGSSGASHITPTPSLDASNSLGGAEVESHVTSKSRWPTSPQDVIFSTTATQMPGSSLIPSERTTLAGSFRTSSDDSSVSSTTLPTTTNMEGISHIPSSMTTYRNEMIMSSEVLMTSKGEISVMSSILDELQTVPLRSSLSSALSSSPFVGQTLPPSPTSASSQSYLPSSSVSGVSQKQDTSFECNFERGLCGWEQSADDSLEWGFRSGLTDFDGTGPEYDHFVKTGRYLYIQTTWVQYNKNAKLLFRNFTGSKCFSFYYHMRGPTIGKLNVYINESLVFTRVGHQSHGWMKGRVFLNGSNSEVVVEGVGGSGFSAYGIIIIDEFALTDSCKGQLPNGSFECSFDDDLCGWQQSHDDDFDWSGFVSGATGVSVSAPSYDHTSGEGAFIYIMTSYPQNVGDKATMVFKNYTGSKCFTFYYQMYGMGVLTLNIYVDGLKVYNTSGYQGYTWRAGQVMLNGSDSEVMCEGVAVSGSYGNTLALDDFILTDKCNSSWLLPVNGTWDPWSEWSECLRIPNKPPCGVGIRSRERLCNWPVNGGEDCLGYRSQNEPCNLTTICPDDDSMSCNFDQSFCGWEQSLLDDVDWRVAKGKNEDEVYGPSGDHTSGDGYYLSLESYRGYNGDIASFQFSRTFTGTICLTFYYYMAGSFPGNMWLSLDGQAVFGNNVGHGNRWKKTQMKLQGSNSEVMFSAYAGDGTIGLDDFNVTAECDDKSVEAVKGEWSSWGPVAICYTVAYQPPCGIIAPGVRIRTCTNPPPSNGGVGCRGTIFLDDTCMLAPCPGNLTFNCTFDDGYCGWKQSLTDEFDWFWMNKSTLTANTGPQHDHTSGHGHFIFIDSYTPRLKDKAQLKFSNVSGAKNLSFWYHMFGTGIGNLNVYVDGTEVFSVYGDQGDVWKPANVEIITNSSEIMFEAVVGINIYGDIALDDISLTDISPVSYEVSSYSTPVIPTSQQASASDTSQTGSSQVPSGQPEVSKLSPKPEEPPSSSAEKHGFSLLAFLPSLLKILELVQGS